MPVKQFLKTFLLFSLMFASHEGFSSSESIDTLYKGQLIQEYAKLKKLKIKAQDRKIVYIVLAVLALALFFVLVYFFKLMGVFAAIIMIGAGYFILKSSAPVVGLYEKLFQENIISPITNQTAGFVSSQPPLSEETLEVSHLFSPEIKQFSSWNLYQKEGIKFSYIHVAFDTKHDDSVERIAENIFDGYLIMIDMPNKLEGVLVSEKLRDKVAINDTTMRSFFSKGDKAGKQNGFDIYGSVSQENRDKVSPLHDKMVAVSYRNTMTYILLYKNTNPFSIDVFHDFDLLQAKKYEDAIVEIESLIQIIK